MQTLHRFLRLIAPYWFNRHNRVAWALLAAAACRLMQTLKTALPDTLCLAISHQAAIKALFARQIDLNRYRAPAGLE